MPVVPRQNPAAAAVVSLLACACNGAPIAGGSERPPSPDAAADRQASCPQAFPAAGTPCDQADLVCEYGDDPRRPCRQYAICTAGGDQRLWRLRETSCAPLPPASCPPSYFAAENMPCPTLQAYCGYGDLSCACGNCRWVNGLTVRCDGPGTWFCDRPNVEPGCPAGAPRLGSPCAPEAHRCSYGCGPGDVRLCLRGLWHPRDGEGCPIP